LQISSDWHITPAHVGVHVNELKSAVGLQTSSGPQVPGHGFGLHEPVSSHTSLQPWQGVLKQLSATHLPAFGPKFVQTSGALHWTPKQGGLQPSWPAHVQTGRSPQPVVGVPAGPQIGTLFASVTTAPGQLLQVDTMQNSPIGAPVWLFVTISQT
jgi:hypothetical protein